MTTVNDFEPLTIIKKGSMLHAAGVLNTVDSLALVETFQPFQLLYVMLYLRSTRYILSLCENLALQLMG